MSYKLPEKPSSQERWFYTDETFNNLYPATIRDQARRHWTPLRVARKASHFLAAKNGARILDIGSGIGKFCLAAAYEEIYRESKQRGTKLVLSTSIVARY